MYRGAIGIIETRGLVGSVEAADAMTKCATVDLLGREEVGGGYFAVGVRGDVGSVRAALEAGVPAAERAGDFRGVLFIPRPHDELGLLLADFEPLGAGAASPLRTGAGGAARGQRALAGLSEVDLARLNVHELRGLARELPQFPLRGREISRAPRARLEELIRRLLGRQADGADRREDGDAS